MENEVILEMITQHELWLSSSQVSGEQLISEDLLLQGLDLSARNFGSAELPGTRFIECTLQDTDFFGANLASAEFNGCVIERCLFAKANLDYSKFD